MSTLACSNMRLRYTAKMASPKGEEQLVKLEKSYPVGGSYKTLCYVTAIAFGGSCWFYLVMPTTDQKEQFRTDAKRILSKHFSNDKLVLKDEWIGGVSWENADTSVDVQPIKD